jgi:transcriptional regulator with XRE-family HTH domain
MEERYFDSAHFAARVKKRRGSASLRAAARELDTSFSTLDRIERGRLIPDVEFFLWLCLWMEAPPQEFFRSGEKSEPGPDTLSLVERALRQDGVLDPELIEALTLLLTLLYKDRRPSDSAERDRGPD